MPMFDWADDLTLVKQTRETDDYGNRKAVETLSTIQANKKDIMRNEFYQAAQAGIRPAFLFIIHPFEYDDETIVIYEGKRYTVVRQFQRSDDELELYVERKVVN